MLFYFTRTVGFRSFCTGLFPDTLRRFTLKTSVKRLSIGNLGKGWIGFFRSLGIRVIYRVFDGVIVISDYLQEYMLQDLGPPPRLSKYPFW